MGRIAYTFSMMRSSWEVLKKDRELLLFPVFSSICCLLVLASFAVPLYWTGAWQLPAEEEGPVAQAAYYAIWFLFYFINYFVIIFFNSAVVACAIFRMRGGNPTLSTGVSAAMARLPQIVGWALVSATIGIILRIIESGSRHFGHLVAGILGAAWTVLTFLVVPILVVERKGPLTAAKESMMLVKKTWGEQLVAHFGFGFIFFLLGIPGLGLFAAGIFMPSTVLKVVFIVAGFIYMVLLGLVQSTLQTIFQAAVYLYVRDGRAPEGFDRSDLAAAMRQR